MLTDIEAITWLGRYYAHKQSAISALEKASRSWQRYTRLCTSQYRPQALARVRTLDWDALAKEVEKEVVTVRLEDSPK